MICGCAYTTKEVNMNPIETSEWKPLYNSSAKYPRLYYDCNVFHVEAKFITIESAMYSAGPIVPIIPFPVENAHKSDSNKLELEIVLSVDMSDINKFEDSHFEAILTEESLFVELNQGTSILKPLSYDVKYGQPKKREYYQFNFDADPKNISDFKLIFSEPIGGCVIPPLVYEYKDLGIEYNVLSN